MFKVVRNYQEDDTKQVTVFAVRETGGMTWFLIWYFDKWVWDDADNYRPISQN